MKIERAGNKIVNINVKTFSLSGR